MHSVMLHVWSLPVTSYVKAFTSYRLTDVQTDRNDQNYIPLLIAGGQLANIFMLNHMGSYEIRLAPLWNSQH